MKNFLLRHKKTLLIVFVVTIAVACVGKVLTEYQWSAIWKALQKSDFSLFLVGTTISIIFYWLARALRWQILLKSDGVNLPFRQIYLVTSVSVGLSTITPFQSGEALKVEYLRKQGAQNGRMSGYAIFLLERLLDLLTVVAMGILGVTFGFDFGVPNYYFYLFALFLIGGAAAGVIIIFKFPSARLDPIRALLRAKKQQKSAIFAAFLLSMISWMMVIVGWKIAFSSVSIDVNLLQTGSVVALTALLTIISFVPGAVGVSEVSVSTVLAKMGVETSVAQTGAIAIRGYALMILALTVAHWIVLKLVLRKNSNDLIVGQKGEAV